MRSGFVGQEGLQGVPVHRRPLLDFLHQDLVRPEGAEVGDLGVKEAQVGRVVLLDAEQGQVVTAEQAGVAAVALDDFSVVDSAIKAIQAGQILLGSFRAVLK